MDEEIPARLTARNLEILQRYAAGATIDCIAETLGLNPRTVKGHMFRARRKLGAASNANAAVIAAKLGLIAVQIPPSARTVFETGLQLSYNQTV
jgi:LuxR family transcriptional regulator, quorum-sensing system regulator BjaR1